MSTPEPTPSTPLLSRAAAARATRLALYLAQKRYYKSLKGQMTVRRCQRNARKRKRALLRRYKNRPCTDCGQRYPPPVMEFDHVRGVKDAEVSFLFAHNAAIWRIEQEIAKCELVCANCHRLRHLRRYDWKS